MVPIYRVDKHIGHFMQQYEFHFQEVYGHTITQRKESLGKLQAMSDHNLHWELDMVIQS